MPRIKGLRKIGYFGLRKIGYFDCPGGGQVYVNKGYAYVAHMDGPDGTTIVDVKDPKRPRSVAHLQVPPGVHSHKVRVVNDLMLVKWEAPRPTSSRQDSGAGSASTTCR